MLSWEEVGEMARGGIQFGSHTKNHVCLDEVSAEVAKQELIEGHEELRRRLPEGVSPPDTIALPRGKLGPFQEDDLRARGFRAVMTTEARVNRPSEAGLFVHRRDGKMLTLRGRHHEAKLRLELTGIPDRIRRLLGVKSD
jgi:peptidoglycan/xylan/chitin deacetylase (PgdA/CDA1 family)